MKICFAFILSCSILSCSAQPLAKSREIVFQSVNVVPMDNDIILPNKVVVIRDGKIFSISDSKNATWSKNAVVVNAAGKYLMPGLAEMHAHVPPVDDIESMKEVLTLFVTGGVTTIRGMLGHPRHLELRSQIQSGQILGPRFLTAGPSFNGNSVKTAEEAEALVRQQKKAGYDFLKLHPGLVPETFDAMAKTAREVGIPFAGHVSYKVGVWRAIAAGYATIDHLDGFVESLVPDIENIPEQQAGLFAMFAADKADTNRIPKLVAALRDNKIWVVPTQSLAERWFAPGKDPEALRAEPEMKYMDAKTLGNWVTAKKNLMNHASYEGAAVDRFIALRRKLIYDCYHGGVGLLLGSDAPQVFDVPGFSIHHELQYLVDAGLRPYEALRTGTVNVGLFYNRPDWGVVKPGAAADLVLLNGNPLQDISRSRQIEGVVLNGQWLPKTWIEQQRKALEKK